MCQFCLSFIIVAYKIYKLAMTQMPSANILLYYEWFLSGFLIVCNDRGYAELEELEENAEKELEGTGIGSL